MPFDLTAEEWSSLLQGLARGEYEMPAGGGCKSRRDRRRWPAAARCQTLAKELARTRRRTADGDVELRTIYEIVEDLKDRRGRIEQGTSRSDFQLPADVAPTDRFDPLASYLDPHIDDVSNAHTRLTKIGCRSR